MIVIFDLMKIGSGSTSSLVRPRSFLYLVLLGSPTPNAWIGATPRHRRACSGVAKRVPLSAPSLNKTMPRRCLSWPCFCQSWCSQAPMSVRVPLGRGSASSRRRSSAPRYLTISIFCSALSSCKRRWTFFDFHTPVACSQRVGLPSTSATPMLADASTTTSSLVGSTPSSCVIANDGRSRMLNAMASAANRSNRTVRTRRNVACLTPR